MLVRNGGRLICLLLAVSAVVASVNDEAKFESVVMVNKDVVITDSKFAWLPTEEMRLSWGSHDGASGKWGFVSASAPHSKSLTFFCSIRNVHNCQHTENKCLHNS